MVTDRVIPGQHQLLWAGPDVLPPSCVFLQLTLIAAAFPGEATVLQSSCFFDFFCAYLDVHIDIFVLSHFQELSGFYCAILGGLK